MVERPDPRFETVNEGLYRERRPSREEQLRDLLRARGLGETDAALGAVQPGLIGTLIRPERTPEEAEVNWQIREDQNGNLVQVHPRTGQVRPIMQGEAPLRAPPPSSNRDPDVAANRAIARARQKVASLTEGGLALHQIMEDPDVAGVLDMAEAQGLHLPAAARIQGNRTDAERRVLVEKQQDYDAEVRRMSGAPHYLWSEEIEAQLGPRPSSRPQAEKQTITQDQADYLREVAGWSPERIASTYTVR